MTRQVPSDKRLSDEDRAYLHMRGEHDRVKQMDERFPEKSDDDDEEVVDDGPEEDEEEAEDYGTWTVQELDTELKRRQLSVAGTKPEKVARLEQDDLKA